jgi:16S rRNA (guanine527-N7)-methyltransferase
MADDAVETEPSAAAAVFGARIDAVRRFTADLAQHSDTLGLLGPRELTRIWTRHVLNCGLLASLVPHGATVGDVGSGAGLPGLVLAAGRPDLSVTLIDSMERRIQWLRDESTRLGLTNVTVLHARGEAVTDRFDVVTARAVGALTTLIPITSALAKPGGTLLLMKGAGVAAEQEKAKRQIRRARLVDVRVEIVGTGVGVEPTRIFRATVPAGDEFHQ